MNAIETACEIIGSQRALAEKLSLTPAAINQWVSGSRPIPDDHCPAIEKETGGKVACESLRPDLHWVRIPDKTWPHPKGRPLVDHSAKKAA